ncbi:RNA binding domain-containing protein [Karstenula rhodostoma CBS 690.94]|uniref:RNA binding domain-containing protein n=1 Tax=Karstenula rhodostoma CBS 690.94 TaxID=1392251 RepID=A0A9P4P5Z4_9PLEO|nr:RNA binding domain-containing protein [Karstenula rhodostoma CBS 690.94]
MTTSMIQWGRSQAVPSPVTIGLSVALGRVLVSRNFERNPFHIKASIYASILSPFCPLLAIMFLLRRTAARAIASTPSSAVFIAPRSFSSITPTAFRARKQQWSVSAFQKRFLSEEPHKVQTTDAEAKEIEEKEGFAQTAAEAPVEDNLTPAQEEVQAAPTDAEHTVGIDALEQATNPRSDSGASRQRNRPVRERNTVPNKVVYVGNLYYEVTADQLKRVFSRFGEIDTVRLIYDNRGLSRGFGYVEFNSVESAQAACENLDMQVFEGRNLVVQFHAPKENSRSRTSDGSFTPNPPSKTLFIGNMSFEMSDKDLNDLFRDIRNVMDVRVAIDRRTGQPRGFAHADFIDVASATRAKEVLGGKTIYGRELRIDFSKSGTNNQRGEGEGGDRPRN